MKYKNMTGMTFGDLTVVCKSKRENAKQQAFWICRCSCGRFLVVRGDNLRAMKRKMCSSCRNGAGKPSVFLTEKEVKEVVLL